MQAKIDALTTLLKIDTGEITELEFDDDEPNKFDANGGKYLVLTDLEATDLTWDCIEDTLWTFDASFIIDHCYSISNGVSGARTLCAIKRMQEELREDANPIIHALIEDLPEFVDDATDVKGRGHFLANYDHKEHEVNDYYIYRTN